MPCCYNGEQEKKVNMLKKLTIQNFALMEKIELELESGFNVITGETGAGKSILVDAMSLLLGERANTDLIRSGTEKAVIEGEFDAQSVYSTLSDILSDVMEWPPNTLIIRREMSSRGQNRCFINDHLVTLSILKNVGDVLADLHGQHEHQSLLNTETHLAFLDASGQYDQAIKAVAACFAEAEALDRRLENLLGLRKHHVDQSEAYLHQLKELEEVAPEKGEDERLIEEERVSANAEGLRNLASQAHYLLYEAENNALGILSATESLLTDLAKIDHSKASWQAELKNVRIVIAEMARELADFHSKISVDSEKLEVLRDRIFKLQHLRKKYGSLEKAIERRDELRRLVSINENYETEIANIKKRLFTSSARFASEATGLSQQRKQYAAAFDKKVIAEMKRLGIEHPRFVTLFRSISAGKSLRLSESEFINGRRFGIDDVEFLISTNPGEDVKPLSRVASGGEISRIMLALKTVMTNSDNIPTLVFDEIDVGISGRIAQVVGKNLAQIAKKRQIFCITHLPQIASMATAHFAVTKNVEAGKTVTRIRKLHADETVFEIAKLLSGEKVTPAVMENAREMLSSSRHET